jgi:hypothetical protein
MAHTWICPSCGKAATVNTLPVDTCPSCGAPVPEALREEIEKTYKPQRPISLTVQVYLGLLVGVVLLAMLPDAFSVPDDSAYRTLNEMLGMRLAPPPHLHPILKGILSLAQALLLLWSSVSLARDEAKSRTLLLAAIFLLTVPEPVLTAPFLADDPFARSMFAVTVLTNLLCLASAWLYLFRWKYCIRYYATLHYLETRAKERLQIGGPRMRDEFSGGKSEHETKRIGIP